MIQEIEQIADLRRDLIIASDETKRLAHQITMLRSNLTTNLAKEESSRWDSRVYGHGMNWFKTFSVISLQKPPALQISRKTCHDHLSRMESHLKDLGLCGIWSPETPFLKREHRKFKFSWLKGQIMPCVSSPFQVSKKKRLCLRGLRKCGGLRTSQRLCPHYQVYFKFQIP